MRSRGPHRFTAPASNDGARFIAQPYHFLPSMPGRHEWRADNHVDRSACEQPPVGRQDATGAAQRNGHDRTLRIDGARTSAPESCCATVAFSIVSAGVVDERQPQPVCCRNHERFQDLRDDVTWRHDVDVVAAPGTLVESSNRCATRPLARSRTIREEVRRGRWGTWRRHLLARPPPDDRLGPACPSALSEARSNGGGSRAGTYLWSQPLREPTLCDVVLEHARRDR
jgi:hypothetical protein